MRKGNPKMGKNWPKNRNGPRRAPEIGKKWPKNGEQMGFGVIFLFFLPCLGHFFPISGRGPFSFFWPIFSHFWISARLPFYTRRPDSQHRGGGSHSPGQQPECWNRRHPKGDGRKGVGQKMSCCRSFKGQHD